MFPPHSAWVYSPQYSLPWRKEMAIHSSILAWETAWHAAVHGVTESDNGLATKSPPPLSAFVVVSSLSCVQLFVTPWTAARQASLSFTISQSFLKLMSIELVMPSNPLVLCCPLLLPSIFSSIRVFSNELALCIK